MKNRTKGILLFVCAGLAAAGILGYLALPRLVLSPVGGRAVRYEGLEQWKEHMKKRFPEIVHISARRDFHGETFYLEITCWPWEKDPAQEILNAVKEFAGQENFVEDWYASQDLPVPKTGRAPLLVLEIYDTAQAEPLHTYSAGWDEKMERKSFDRAYGPQGREPVYTHWREGSIP